jgi:hypothetical protein
MRSIASLSQINPRASLEDLLAQQVQLWSALDELKAADRSLQRLIAQREDDAADLDRLLAGFRVNHERDALLSDY